MHSIMITNKCNNKCKYCFASDTRNEKQEFITIEDYKYALDFLSQSFDSIGIIGGEPTLHPKFRKILNLIVTHKKIKSAVIFTNGEKISNFIDIIKDDKFSILINCNSPQDIGVKKYENLKRNIIKCTEELGASKFKLGFNLYAQEQDFSFILELLKITKQKDLRFAIAVPVNSLIKNYNIIDFHNSMKGTMFKFFKELQRIDVTPRLDCNSIPNCLLTEEEKLYLKELSNNAIQNGIKIDLLNNKRICTPQIVIKTDLSAIRCFSSGDYCKAHIKQFKKATDLYKYFYLKIDVFQQILFNKEECIECKDRLINCDICNCYNTQKIEKIKQFCLKEGVNK